MKAHPFSLFISPGGLGCAVSSQSSQTPFSVPPSTFFDSGQIPQLKGMYFLISQPFNSTPHPFVHCQDCRGGAPLLGVDPPIQPPAPAFLVGPVVEERT